METVSDTDADSDAGVYASLHVCCVVTKDSGLRAFPTKAVESNLEAFRVGLGSCHVFTGHHGHLTDTEMSLHNVDELGEFLAVGLARVQVELGQAEHRPR